MSTHDVPIFEVAFEEGMWWSIPEEISQKLYQNYMNNEDAVYNSWQPDEEATYINRYMIDFQTWEQRNLRNDRRQSVRLVWVAADKVDPTWTGQIPSMM